MKELEVRGDWVATARKYDDGRVTVALDKSKDYPYATPLMRQARPLVTGSDIVRANLKRQARRHDLLLRIRNDAALVLGLAFCAGALTLIILRLLGWI